jgi:hypothetical protein
VAMSTSTGSLPILHRGVIDLKSGNSYLRCFHPKVVDGSAEFILLVTVYYLILKVRVCGIYVKVEMGLEK